MSTPDHLSHLSPSELADLAEKRALLYGESATADGAGYDDGVARPQQLIDKIQDRAYANSLQTDWNGFRLSQLRDLSGFGLATEEALGTLAQAVESLKPVVEAIRVAVEIGALLIIEGLDVISSLLEISALALEAFVDLFATTGVGMLTHVPKTLKQAMTIRQSLEAIASSYDDASDDDRPVFRSSNDTHFFWGAFAYAPNLNALKEAVEVLKKLFTMGGVDTTPYEVDTKTMYPNNLGGHVDQGGLDWDSLLLRDVPAFSGFFDNMNGLIAGLRRGSKRVETAEKLLRILVARLDAIQQQVNAILDIIRAFVGLAQPNIAYLSLFGGADMSTFQDALRAAPSKTTYPIPKPEVEMCAFVCFHAVLGTGRALDAFNAIFATIQKTEQSYRTNVQPKIDRLQALSDPQGSTQQTLAIWKGNTQ